jgi:hypothetical protein
MDLAVQAPVPPVQAEATIEAWNQHGIPWPDFVAAVRAGIQFPGAVFEEFPEQRLRTVELDAAGNEVKVLQDWRGKILIGTKAATVSKA